MRSKMAHPVGIVLPLLLTRDSILDAKPDNANSLLPSAPSFTSHTLGIEPMMSSCILISDIWHWDRSTLGFCATRCRNGAADSGVCFDAPLEGTQWILLTVHFPLPITFRFHLSASICTAAETPIPLRRALNLIYLCSVKDSGLLPLRWTCIWSV